jgi:hypothetical protein
VSPLELCLINPEGEQSPLVSAGDLRVKDHVLASLSGETRPLLGAALREHRKAGRQNALTLLVAPRPAPEAARSDDMVTAFLASGEWVRALLEGGSGSAVELCYRALASALGPQHSSIALRIVDRETKTDPAILETDATIDVIMPHRGSDEHLQVALASLGRQSFRGRNILCFDQRPDPELVRNLAKQDDLDLFEIVPSPAGPYVCRQHFGLASTARYVAFQDSDDYSVTSRLAALAAFAEAQGADIVGSHELRLDEMKRTVEAIRYPLDVNHALTLGVGSVQLFSTTIMRSDVLRRLGGFSTIRTYAADRHFQLRASLSARVLNLDSFLYVRRRQAGSLSTAASTGMNAPDRRRINQLWNEAFQAMASGRLAAQEARSAAAKSVFRIEYALDEFMMRNLRTGVLSPALLRAHDDHANPA